jgi:intracellular multiplication protein IcmL
MSKGAQELEFSTNQLYRDHYRAALGGVILMSVLTAVLVGILIFMTLKPTKPKYYATTTTGVVVPLFSLSQPVVTKPYLLQWASLATRAAYNLSFDNYQAQLKSASAYFTANGFAKFNKALKTSGLLNEVINKKLVMSAVVNGDPVIVKNFISRGVHMWEVQLPLLVSFESASENRTMNLLVSMRIQRVSTLGAEKGILISDFIVGSGS